MVALGRLHDFFDLGRLVLDQGVSFAEAVEFGHCGCGPRRAPVVPIVTGGFGEEDYADAEDDGPDEADPHGNAVGAGVGHGFGAVVDAVGGEDTDRDEELVAAVSG